MTDSTAMPKLQAGGTLDFRKHLYITREQDEQELFEYLNQGEYCNIIASRQVGKSSLMMKTAARLTEHHKRVAIIDIAGELGSAEESASWYKGLLSRITQDCDINIDVHQWWEQQSGMTANQCLIRFVKEILLGQSELPLVVFIDEVESTIRLSYTDDFFTAIRTMYNERSRDPIFEKIVFCLIGVVMPNELIKERRTTPYNIGHTIELSDFDFEKDDLNPLIRSLSSDPRIGREILGSVFSWTAGHPFLTMWICSDVVKKKIGIPEEIDVLIKDKFGSLEKVDNHPHFEYVVSFLGDRVLDKLDAYKVYEQLLKGEEVRDRAIVPHIQLKLAGLVKRDSENNLRIRNRIYEMVFNQYWVQQSKPQRLLRSLQHLAVGLSVILVILVTWLVYDNFVLEPPRRIARHLESQLDQTLDETIALNLFQRLSGQKEDPNLGKHLTGYDEEAQQGYDRFLKRKEKMVVDELIATLKNTVNESQAKEVFEILSGQRDDPTLKKKITGYEQTVQDYYNTFLTRVSSLIADKLLVALNSTNDEDNALELFEFLTGQEEVPELGKKLRGFENQGLEAYRNFWDRRADKLEGSALRKLKEQRVDEALILGSLAGLKRSGAVHPELMNTHDDRGYSRLKLTFRGSFYDGLAYSSDGELLSAGISEPFGVPIWDTRTGKEITLLKGHIENVGNISFSPNNLQIVTASTTGSAYVWDVKTGQLLFPINGHNDAVTGSIYAHHGQRIATSSYDRTARIWRSSNGEERLVIRLNGFVLALAYSPDDKWLATASEDIIRIWDTKNGNQINQMIGHESAVWGLQFSPDGQWIASASDDQTARLWDATSGRQLVQFGGHRRSVRTVSFSSDGQYLATASDDKTARIWGTASEKELLKITAHTSTVLSAVFSPNGKRLATVSLDGTARIWDIAKLGEEFTPTESETPLQIWQNWQRKLNLTVNENDEVVPLWPIGPQQYRGWSETLMNEFKQEGVDIKSTLPVKQKKTDATETIESAIPPPTDDIIDDEGERG